VRSLIVGTLLILICLLISAGVIRSGSVRVTHLLVAICLICATRIVCLSCVIFAGAAVTASRYGVSGKATDNPADNGAAYTMGRETSYGRPANGTDGGASVVVMSATIIRACSAESAETN